MTAYVWVIAGYDACMMYIGTITSIPRQRSHQFYSATMHVIIEWLFHLVYLFLQQHYQYMLLHFTHYMQFRHSGIKTVIGTFILTSSDQQIHLYTYRGDSQCVSIWNVLYRTCRLIPLYI